MKAFAKINLGLRVLGKRADGFHDLDTVFARIGLADDLEFKLRKDGKIVVKVEGEKISQKDNLVFRAACLLRKHSSQGVEITLKKRIPIGAGLGGGSSDAAATLKVLNKLWKLKLPRKELEKLALSLGSDVPFFLHPGVQRGRGRGEMLENAKLSTAFPKNVLLIVPNFKISTKWAFSKIPNSKLQIPNKSQISKSKQAYQLPTINYKLPNDFEKVIFPKYPELRKAKNRLLKSVAKVASLSGSGSAVFGLFQKQEAVKKVAKDFEEFGQVFVTKIRT